MKIHAQEMTFISDDISDCFSLFIVGIRSKNYNDRICIRIMSFFFTFFYYLY